jgi:hypothetical protein
MSLSSNTLIHFTNHKEKLKQILEENFRVFNCRETVILGGQNSTWHLPMVSFCDIPLSEVKNHISKYGEYGLGMTKEWGMRKGLNPVLYVAQQSFLSESYRTAWDHFNMEPEDEDIDDWNAPQRALADVLRYIKNYEADLTRNGVTTKNYRFSDEREWRFVPPYTEDCEMLLHTDYYNSGDNKNAADQKLESLRLVFEPADIKYIIIRDDSEIAEFIDHLRRAKGKNFSLHDVERLTTRILTTEQIMGDI